MPVRSSAPSWRRRDFQVRRLAYNNFFIFPIAAALILRRRLSGQAPALAAPDLDDDAYQVEMEPAAPLMNATLTAVGWTEAALLRWVNLPIGTSIICMAGTTIGGPGFLLCKAACQFEGLA